MKAKLDGLYSPDLPQGYSELPKDPKICWVVVHADIGLDDDEASADCFTFYVCTPKFIEEYLRSSRFLVGRALIMVPEFNWMLVEDAINSICSEINGATWSEIARELSKFGEYEFDNADLCGASFP